MSAVDACVVGAGLSGLACAFDLARAGKDVVVLEARERAGGFAGTDSVEGFLFERGPNTLQAAAASFRRLCGDAGVAERLIASSEHARARYVLHRGRLRALPSGPGSLLATPLFTLGAKVRLLSEPLRRRAPHPAGRPEPTARELLEERLGREPTELLAAAFVRGIYAGDIDALGARSAFPRLWRLVEGRGGIVRGLLGAERDRSPLPGPDVPRSRLLSFPGGLQELVDALARALGPRLVPGRAARALERADGGFRVVADGGAPVVARAVVLAVPAPAAADLLEPFVSARACGHLRGIDLAGVALVHLGFARAELVPPPGFGFLVPPAEEGDVTLLGAIFGSNLFPGRAPEGASSVSCFLRAEDVRGLAPAEAAERAAEQLGRVLGLARSPRPRVHRTIAWERAIPQYTVGHDLRMAELLAETAAAGPLRLAGNYASGVGVEQVVARGRETARELLA